MTARPVTLLVAAVVAVAVSACGDSGLSESDYQERLDAACQRLQELNMTLPQKVRDEHLTLEEAGRLGEGYGEEFRADVEELTPPDSLRDAHERLLELGDRPPPGDDLDALRAQVLAVAELYDDLGAARCEQGQRATLEQLASRAP